MTSPTNPAPHIQPGAMTSDQANGIRPADAVIVLAIGAIAFGATLASHTQLGIQLELAGAAGGAIFASLLMAYVLVRRVRGIAKRTGKLEQRAGGVEDRVSRLESVTGIETSAVNRRAEQPAAQVHVTELTPPEAKAPSIADDAQAEMAGPEPRAQFGKRNSETNTDREDLIDKFARELGSDDTIRKPSGPEDRREKTAPSLQIPESPTMEAIRAVARLQSTNDETSRLATINTEIEAEIPNPQVEPTAMPAPQVPKTLMAEALTQPVAADVQPDPQAAILNLIKDTIANKSLELHLQPVLAITDRRVEFYEVLSRIVGLDGQLMTASEFVPVAIEHGMVSRLDHLMLLKSIQVARRLKERDSHRTLFCNLSIHSLADPGFFSAFLRYLDENRTLTDSLIFEFSQTQFAQAEDVHFTGLKALADIGFHFSMDGIADLSLDLADLRARNFQFLKVNATTLIAALGGTASPEAARHLHDSLTSIGIRLIVEKIEDEETLRLLASSGMNLGQGNLFAEPRPVRSDVFEAQMDKQDQAASAA